MRTIVKPPIAVVIAALLVGMPTITISAQEMLIDVDRDTWFWGKSFPDRNDPESFIRCEPPDNPETIEPLPRNYRIVEFGRICPRHSGMWIMFAANLQDRAQQQARVALQRRDFETARQVLAAAEESLHQAFAPLAGPEGLPESQRQILEQAEQALQRARGALDLGDEEAAGRALDDMRLEREPVAPERPVWEPEELEWHREPVAPERPVWEPEELEEPVAPEGPVWEPEEPVAPEMQIPAPGMQ